MGRTKRGRPAALAELQEQTAPTARLPKAGAGREGKQRDSTSASQNQLREIALALQRMIGPTADLAYINKQISLNESAFPHFELRLPAVPSSCLICGGETSKAHRHLYWHQCNGCLAVMPRKTKPLHTERYHPPPLTGDHYQTLNWLCRRVYGRTAEVSYRTVRSKRNAALEITIKVGHTTLAGESFREGASLRAPTMSTRKRVIDLAIRRVQAALEAKRIPTTSPYELLVYPASPRPPGPPQAVGSGFVPNYITKPSHSDGPPG